MKDRRKEISVEEFRKIFGLDSEQCDGNRSEEPVDVHTENPPDPQPNSDFDELVNGYTDGKLIEEIDRLSNPTYGLVDDAMENRSHEPQTERFTK